MRTTLNISMPPKLFSKVEAVVSENNYSSVSEFIRDAIRAWEELEGNDSYWRNNYEDLVENIKFLSSNKSLDFLKKEPDLYENY